MPGDSELAPSAPAPSATRRQSLRVLAGVVGSVGFALRHVGEVVSKQRRRKRRRLARRRRRKRSRSQGPRMWELTFSDEFDQDSLDEQKWRSGTPWVPKPFDQGEL